MPSATCVRSATTSAPASSSSPATAWCWCERARTSSTSMRSSGSAGSPARSFMVPIVARHISLCRQLLVQFGLVSLRERSGGERPVPAFSAGHKWVCTCGWGRNRHGSDPARERCTATVLDHRAACLSGATVEIRVGTRSVIRRSRRTRCPRECPRYRRSASRRTPDCRQPSRQRSAGSCWDPRSR